MAWLWHRLEHGVPLVGEGGGFDFLAGSAVASRWAPATVRRIGLEWLARLLREPAASCAGSWPSPTHPRSSAGQATTTHGSPQMTPARGGRRGRLSTWSFPASARARPAAALPLRVLSVMRPRLRRGRPGCPPPCRRSASTSRAPARGAEAHEVVVVDDGVARTGPRSSPSRSPPAGPRAARAPPAGEPGQGGAAVQARDASPARGELPALRPTPT